MTEDTIKRARNGDSQAFGNIYDHYVKRIYRYIYFRIKHKETSQDLVSEIFIKIFESIKRVDISKSFDTWVFTICRNTLIDFYRTNKYPVDLDLTKIADSFNLDDQVTQYTLHKQLLASIRNLKQIEKEVIGLTYFAGLDSHQISTILGKSTGNIRIIRHRAIQHLKKIFA